VPVAPEKHVQGNVFVHVNFVLSGVLMTMLGPMLPGFSARWHLTDTQAGYLFTAQFVSCGLGMLLSPLLVSRFGYRRTLMTGLIPMALGTAWLAHAGWIAGLSAISVYGFGYGFNTPAANLFAAEANPENRASALSLINASWGVGAMASPLLVAAAQRAHRLPLFFLGLGAAMFVLAVSMAAVGFQVDHERASRAQASTPAWRLWQKSAVIGSAAFLFTYVGSETAVGGWIASYARRLDLGAHAFWAMTPTFFYGALLAGRSAAPLILRRLRETTVASFGLALSSLGIILVVASPTIAPVVVGVTMAGLGFSAIFPISLSMLSHWFGGLSSEVGGAIFPVAYLGGAALPWLVGAISAQTGSLRAGFLVPLAGSVAMLAAYIANGRRKSAVET
jgi:FHS family glucose/mannose:H+ symporter-like MFS transporter